MLEVNPYFRKRPEELLGLEIFDSYKLKYPELLISPPYQIKLSVDKKYEFDYQNNKFRRMTTRDLKFILMNEAEIVKGM